MKNTLLLIFISLLLVNVVYALELNIDEVITGEQNASFNITSDETIDFIEINVSSANGFSATRNTQEIFLDNLDYGSYNISVWANASSGNESNITKLFSINKLASLDSIQNTEDSFNYTFIGETNFSQFDAELLYSNGSHIGETNGLNSNLGYPAPGDYILRINLTSDLGTNQIFNQSVSFAPFSSNVSKVRFNDSTLIFVVYNNYDCENSSLNIYNNGSLVFSENKNSCENYLANLPISANYTLQYNATSGVHNVFVDQSDFFGVFPSQITTRTTDNLTVIVNSAYSSAVLYPELLISFYQNNNFISSDGNFMQSTLLGINDSLDYEVRVSAGTPTGLLVEEIMSSTADIEESVTTTTTGGSGGSGSNTQIICDDWSSCSDSEQTQTCDNGNSEYTTTRSCVSTNTVEENNSTTGADDPKDDEGQGFFSAITGAVTGSINNPGTYWGIGLLVLLLGAALFFVWKKNNSNKK